MEICPHCEFNLTHIDIKSITFPDSQLSRRNGLSYSCPNCHRALSVGFDPVALNVDLVNAFVQRLRNS